MEVVNNKKQFRFEIALSDGEFAVLEYRWLKGSMVLMHTIVPPSHRKQGIASILVKYVLDYARAQNLKIIPYCQFVLLYLKEHPEYAALVDNKNKEGT